MSVKRALPRSFGEEEVIIESGCMICLHDGRDLPVTSCCGQEVHEDCLSEWLEVCRGKNCPHCRCEMPTVREKTEQGFDPWTFALWGQCANHYTTLSFVDSCGAKSRYLWSTECWIGNRDHKQSVSNKQGSLLFGFCCVDMRLCRGSEGSCAFGIFLRTELIYRKY